ncbi:MAG TPA: SDR family NAD(P)-dependent oxidoreductase [Myxococcota bacterium]|nr:SDR family NAD(P)-dependent oxidoreductase [Myxococcota bacterium]
MEASRAKAEGAALVTGAGRGLGRAIALELARRGFTVHAGVRDPRQVESLLEAARGEGVRVIAERLDVTIPETIAIPARLRVLVNNAGVDKAYLPVEHAPLSLWREMFETNLFGLVEVVRRAVPRLREMGGGVVCNITTSSYLTAVPFYAAYRASKAAVGALGESLRAELLPFGIRVLEVIPGPIDTDMLAASDRLPEAAAHAGYEAAAEKLLAGRRGVAAMTTAPEAAARAIADAIVDDESPLRVACDPLGANMLEAWRSNATRR